MSLSFFTLLNLKAGFYRCCTRGPRRQMAVCSDPSRCLLQREAARVRLMARRHAVEPHPVALLSGRHAASCASKWGRENSRKDSKNTRQRQCVIPIRPGSCTQLTLRPVEPCRAVGIEYTCDEAALGHAELASLSPVPGRVQPYAFAAVQPADAEQTVGSEFEFTCRSPATSSTVHSASRPGHTAGRVRGREGQAPAAGLTDLRRPGAGGRRETWSTTCWNTQCCIHMTRVFRRIKPHPLHRALSCGMSSVPHKLPVVDLEGCAVGPEADRGDVRLGLVGVHEQLGGVEAEGGAAPLDSEGHQLALDEARGLRVGVDVGEHSTEEAALGEGALAGAFEAEVA